ncbi:F390 synthetase-related protein [Crocinitomix catalasitica]|uniref:F390 synthetase-related protein n=1 Tax=Crocinitomix catalasitica TaxID=184607 RepID=UPI000484CDB3|nr:F390 synthetase-related protein [Crocinitomix catalasitica]
MSFKSKLLGDFIALRFLRWRHKKSLKKLQDRGWNKMQAVLEKSEYYQGYTAQNLPLTEYPIINKAIFMDNFDAINTRGVKLKNAFEVAREAEESRNFAPMIEDITIGLSTGTSGNRGVFLATESERAQWVGCILDRVIGFSLKQRKVAFFLRANSNLYSSVKSKLLSFEFFDLMLPMTEHINRINTLQPTILVAQPSLLIELAREVEMGNVNIFPQKIISVAEVLYPEDAVYLSRVFNQKIHQVYQCTEGLLATTCSEGTLHFNEDFLIIEKRYLDEKKERFFPIITDLKRSTQPIVRYELNDIIHEKENCPCGSPFTGIAQIEGRADDVLRFKTLENIEKTIFPDFFRRAIVQSHDSIIDYTLVQTEENRLELFIDSAEVIRNMAKSSIQKLLTDNGINAVDIITVNERHHEKGNKLRRIRNDYWKTN